MSEMRWLTLLLEAIILSLVSQRTVKNAGILVEK